MASRESYERDQMNRERFATGPARSEVQGGGVKLKLRYCPGYTPHRRRCGSLTTHTLCNRCRLEESRDALAKYVEVQRECAARRGEGGE